MGRKNARILSQWPNKTASLQSRSKRNSNISDRFSLSHGNTSSNVTSGLLGKKKLIKTYSRHKPVQVTKKYHFLTPDTPEFEEMTQQAQKIVNSSEVNVEETLKPKPPHLQEEKEILQKGEEQRHIDDQGNDSSSSCTLVTVNNSLNQATKLFKSNTNTASLVSGLQTGRSGIVSDGSSLEIPRHADKESSGSFSRSSYLGRKKIKPNRTSYTVKSMLKCSSRLPRPSKGSLSTVKSMSLCTPLGQCDSPWNGEDDAHNMESLAEEEPQNSTWNENSMKLLLKDFLPESAISPIKGRGKDSNKKSCVKVKKTNQLRSYQNREISFKDVKNQGCRPVDADDAKNSIMSNEGKIRAVRRCNEAKMQTFSSPVQQTRRAVQKGGSNHADLPITSTRIYSKEHALFELDISAVESQAKAVTKSFAQGYCTEELLDYDPHPLQASTSVGDIGTAAQTLEKDVTPETEEQKLRRLTVPRSVRRLEMRTGKHPDCVLEDFALGKRKKAKVSVCRVQRRKTRNIGLKNSPETILVDSLIMI